MKSIHLSLGLACLILFGCKKEEVPNPNKPAAAGENPLTAPVDYLGAVAKAKKSATKSLSTVSLDQAIQVFFTQEDRYPTNLNELVDKRVIPSLPDPPAGMKYAYDPVSGKARAVAQ